MGTTETVAKAVAKTEPARDLRKLIESSAKELARALPAHMRPERLVRIGLTCIRTTPELMRCTPESFLGALFTAAQIGVEPVAKRAYILPFNNKRQINGEWKTVKEAQYILGYPGIVELFYRHKKAVQLAWGVVREGDYFDFEDGTSAFLRHKPAKSARGKVIGYYVVATLANGGKMFQYMTREECIEHGKKHSKTYDKKAEKFYDSSPWVTSEDSMCLKTVLIQTSKLMPLSVELQSAIQQDETSRDYRRGIDNVLDIPPTTNWEETPAEEINAKDPETGKPANIVQGGAAQENK